jgi:hypothetical protein
MGAVVTVVYEVASIKALAISDAFSDYDTLRCREEKIMDATALRWTPRDLPSVMLYADSKAMTAYANGNQVPLEEAHHQFGGLKQFFSCVPPDRARTHPRSRSLRCGGYHDDSGRDGGVVP